jgi:hypothetical protein
MRTIERRIAAVLLILSLAACKRSEPSPQAAAPSTDRPAPPSALERAALEAGVIPDAAKLSPIGLYQRRHEAGRDSLCLVPGKDRRYRFALEAIFGTEQHCQGEGTARRVGTDKLILHFSGRPQCIVVAQYDGDRIALPGVLDINCAALCSDRGSLEGVAFPRLSNDLHEALAVRDQSGDAMCPS